MTDAQKEDLRKTVEGMLEGFNGHPDTPFNRLGTDSIDLEHQILKAEDEQVEEATEHPSLSCCADRR
jgi:hypothetical protein